MLNIGIYGASGRVGTLLINILRNDANATVSSVFAIDDIDNPNLPKECKITNSREDFLNSCDVVIDFSLPEGIEELITTALDKKIYKPLVIATTGLNKHQTNLVKTASEFMPVLYATNMSLGVAVLNTLVAKASKTLRDFDIEIVEQHHRYKKDSPSGTALTLATSVAEARDLDINSVRVSGRDGNIGERSSDEIAVMALRGGDIVGRHTVGFYNDGEFIELNHTATSRETFAKGAIRVAKWLITQKSDFYSINDCLGL